MNQSLKIFIESNQEMFIEWLRHTRLDFPYCCTFASEVLGCYINEFFQEVILVYGGFETEIQELWEWDEEGLCDEPNMPFHAWLNIAGSSIIIDFTAFQFDDKISETDKDVRKLSFSEIKESQGDVIITDTMPLYSNYISPMNRYKCSKYTQYAKGKSFKEYLQQLLENDEDNKYRYNEGLIPFS